LEYDQEEPAVCARGKRKFSGVDLFARLGVWLHSDFNSKSFGKRWPVGRAVKGASFRDEICCARFYTVDECASKMGRLMVQAPNSGTTKPGRMKVDFELRARPRSDCPQGKENQQDVAGSVAQSEHRRS